MNYLNNYPYGYVNQYVPQPQPQQFISQPIQPQVQPPQALNGKIVDSEDVVKATEVPVGGYGIFPKADLSEIYIKSWNNNGTTSVITFKPIAPKPTKESETENVISLLLKKVETLETKMDTFIFSRPESTMKAKKVEVEKNDF